MIFGKQIEGPKSLKPSGFIWAGMIWLFVWDRSVIIPLPQFVNDFLMMVGFNPYDR